MFLNLGHFPGGGRRGQPLNNFLYHCIGPVTLFKLEPLFKKKELDGYCWFCSPSVTNVPHEFFSWNIENLQRDKTHFFPKVSNLQIYAGLMKANYCQF